MDNDISPLRNTKQFWANKIKIWIFICEIKATDVTHQLHILTETYEQDVR